MGDSRLAISLRDVVKRYGEITALDHVSLDIKDGEYVCVIGPSGSGKSTLLKSIAGIVSIDSGEIEVFGERVDNKPIEERDISLVFQDILLFPHMDVAGNIAYPLEVQGDERAEIQMREIASAFTLEGSLHSFPNELSMGIQQKAAIARAVASGSRILLMDEPYGSLDPVTSLKLRHEVKLLAKDLGLTIVHVTHNQEEALSVADRIAVLRRGRLEQYGTPLELYFRPATPFVSRFIGGEANFIEGRVVDERDGVLEVSTPLGVFHVQGFLRAPNGKVLLSVKPEYIVFSVEGVEGKVVYSEFLGEYYRYIVDVAGYRIIVKSFEKRGVGEKVGIKVIPERVVVFEYPREGLDEAIRYE